MFADCEKTTFMPALEGYEDTVLIGKRTQRLWRVWCELYHHWHLHGPERHRHLCFPPAYATSCLYRSRYHLRLAGKWTCDLNGRVAAICLPMDPAFADGPENVERAELHVGVVPASSEEHRGERYEYGPTTRE